MEGEKVGRRGVPSLLTTSSSSSQSSVGQDKHIASDVTQLIGWTPLVKMKRITSKDRIDARVFGKIETYQPLCSVKDRCALGMIEDAEEWGLISPGVATLVEPTGGNMVKRPDQKIGANDVIIYQEQLPVRYITLRVEPKSYRALLQRHSLYNDKKEN